jgi:hypothetical protein
LVVLDVNKEIRTQALNRWAIIVGDYQREGL